MSVARKAKVGIARHGSLALLSCLAVVLLCACEHGRANETAEVAREIRASLQRTTDATRAKDIEAYMAELPPDFAIHDESGAVIDRARQRSIVLRDWSVIPETLALAQTVDDVRLQGSDAIVTTSQRWERRMLRPDGKASDIVLTTQRHRETWRRYGGRWYGYEIEELGGEIFVNGEPYKP